MTSILSITLWLPIAAAVIIAFFPKTAANAIKAVGLISAADMGVDRMQSLKPAQEKEATARLAAHLAAEGMAPHAGCTPESLAKEINGLMMVKLNILQKCLLMCLRMHILLLLMLSNYKKSHFLY